MIAKLNTFLASVAAAVLSWLPDSPFGSAIADLGSQSWIANINWFIPIGKMVAIGTAWLTAIGIFYLYQAILRWAKVVGD